MSAGCVVALDHLVLTVASIEASVAFYAGVLGLTEVRFGDGRIAVAFGAQRIHLHPVEAAIEPRASRPTPGSADFCFIAGAPLDAIAARLRGRAIAIELGPVSRTGARGPMQSLYVRDPDGNLIEIAVYD